MPILIADSGATKADWCLINSDGTTISVQTQGISPVHQSADQIEVIVSNELCPQLQGQTPDAIYFYGSGCRGKAIDNVRSALRSTWPDVEAIEIESDILGAARALCGHAPGIACILGTGANSCLYDGRSITQNTPAMGYILGDEGSGAVLGRNFVNALYKGRLPHSLLREFEDATSLSLDGIIQRVYREPQPNRFLASLSPFIRNHIEIDSVRQLVVDNFRSFLRLNVAPYGRPDLPIGFVGSVAAVYETELRIAIEAENMRLGRIERTPIKAMTEYHCMQNS